MKADPRATPGKPPAAEPSERPWSRAAAGVVGLAVFGLVLGLTWLVDQRFAQHGLNVRWEAILAPEQVRPPYDRDGQLRPAEPAPDEPVEFVVFEGVERRPVMHSDRRPLARFLQHWNFREHGSTARLFRFRATFAGTLELPWGTTLGLDGTGTRNILIDGEPLSEPRYLQAGSHTVAGSWEGDLRHPRTELQWTMDPGTLPFPVQVRHAPRKSEVPPEFFRPARPRPVGWLYALGAFLGLLFGGAGARALIVAGPARRRRAGQLVLVIILALGAFLRAYGYDTMPDYRENGDELFATWNGWSLLEEGRPRGWSIWPHVYGNRVERTHIELFGTADNRGWTVIEPYFEHPPLLHVLVGAAAHLGGAEHWTEAKLAHTRLVPISLGVLTILLVFLLGRRIDPTGPSPYLGAFLYAVLPHIALQGRVIKEEVLLTPMALFAFWLFLGWRDHGWRLRWLLAAAFILGLSASAKITGAFFLPPLIVMIAGRGMLREALLATLAGAAGIAMLFLYAAAIDFDAFWFSTLYQAGSRPMHWNLFPRFFSDGLINHNLIGHGHTLFLWLAYALGIGMAGSRGERGRVDPVLVLPPMVYLSAITISSGNWTFGWYIVPVLPFVAVGAGRFLASLWRDPGLFRGIVFVGLLVMYGMNFLQPVGYQTIPDVWRAARTYVTPFFAAFFVPFLLAQVHPRFFGNWARLMTALGLVLTLATSIFFVAHYDEIFDGHHDFDRIIFFDR